MRVQVGVMLLVTNQGAKRAEIRSSSRMDRNGSGGPGSGRRNDGQFGGRHLGSNGSSEVTRIM